MKILTLYILAKKLKKLNTIFSCGLKIVDKKGEYTYRGTLSMVLTLQLFITWGRMQGEKSFPG